MGLVIRISCLRMRRCVVIGRRSRSVLTSRQFGKPLYSTRIILEDLNPVFEETAMLLVTQNEVKAEEDLSAMLWDSDKRSAEYVYCFYYPVSRVEADLPSSDLLGRIQIPVKELMSTPNKMFDRVDPLVGFENADKMEGKLWSVHPSSACDCR